MVLFNPAISNNCCKNNCLMNVLAKITIVCTIYTVSQKKRHGQYLAKMWTRVSCLPFLTHGVQMYTLLQMYTTY